MFRKYGKYAYWLLGCIGLNTRRILVISRPISAIALQANRNLFSNHAQISDLRKSLITRWQRKTPVSQSLYWNKLGFTIMHLWTRKKNSKWKCYHKKLLRKLRSPLTIHCLKIVRTWSWAKRTCPYNVHNISRHSRKQFALQNDYLNYFKGTLLACEGH